MAGKNTAAFGIFTTRLAAENCIDTLLVSGFRNDDISVLAPDVDATRELATEKNTKAPEGATAGAATGGVLGGTLGLLAGIGALAMRLLAISEVARMKIEYNPRKFLLLVPLSMLRRYFDARGVLGELAWDDLTEDDHEAVYAAWQALPLRARDAVGADFLNVAGLATQQGVQIIIEEGKFHDKDLVAELATLPSHTEKAFYVLLQYPRVFRVASQLNYAEKPTRYWHPRHDLPIKPPNISLEARAALRKAVSDYYVDSQGRGQYHDFDLFRHGPVHYFMVYLSDYPDTFARFNDKGEMKRQPQTPAFDVVFQFDESRGHLDLYAEGPAKLRRDLEEIFAKTALAEDLSLKTPPGVAFHLDHLKDPEFAFPTEPAAQRAGIVVHSMYYSGAGHMGHSYARINWGENYLSELGDGTGGEAYWQGFGSPVSFDGWLKDLAQRLQNQYLLTVMVEGTNGGLEPVRVRATAPGISLVAASAINMQQAVD